MNIEPFQDFVDADLYYSGPDEHEDIYLRFHWMAKALLQDSTLPPGPKRDKIIGKLLALRNEAIAAIPTGQQQTG